MARVINWGKYVPFSKDYPMWVCIFRHNFLLLVAIWGFYLIIKSVYDGAFQKEFISLPWLRSSLIFSLGLLVIVCIIELSTIRKLRYTTNFIVNDDGIGSSAHASHIGADELGSKVINTYESSQFIRWQHIKKVKIRKEKMIIVATGSPWKLPVTIWCSSYQFDDTVEYIKDHLDNDRIRQSE
jgi:hypothetical protein